MSTLDKYIKQTKNILIDPKKDDLEKKILSRLSSLKEDDRSLLDEKFLDYLNKNNSRMYLFSENIQNNPGKFALIFLSGIIFAGLLAFLAVKIISPSKK